MNNKVLTKIGTKLGKVGLVLKKHEPEILAVGGAIGTIASTVLACKATLRVDEVLSEHKETIEKIHSVAAREDMADKYAHEDEKKDVRITYIQTGVKLVKEYAPAVILGSLSLTAMFASNNILKKRSAALAAAYATLDKSFKEYRNRVTERFGDDVESEIRFGTKEQTITETEIDEETGKEKKVKKKVRVADPNLKSDYAAYFTSQTSKYYDSCYDYNLSMLRAKEAYWTTVLASRKYVTLNDVLNSIGMESTKAGMVVGWYYDKDNPDCETIVDFRISEVYLDNGDGTFARTIVIDPNVQGSIYELMEDK